jgi:hypothetical protein
VIAVRTVSPLIRPVNRLPRPSVCEPWRRKTFDDAKAVQAAVFRRDLAALDADPRRDYRIRPAHPIEAARLHPPLAANQKAWVIVRRIEASRDFMLWLFRWPSAETLADSDALAARIVAHLERRAAS